jgi:hypothetical protein
LFDGHAISLTEIRLRHEPKAEDALVFEKKSALFFADW